MRDADLSGLTIIAAPSDAPVNLPPIWRFRRMRRDEPDIDPVQEEFFATEELEDLNGALVREAVQNSLDARDGDTPVEVMFSFGQQDDSRNAIDRAEVFRELAPT